MNNTNDLMEEVRKMYKLAIASGYSNEYGELIINKTDLESIARYFAEWERKKLFKEGLDAVGVENSTPVERTIAGVFVKSGMDRQKEEILEWAKEEKEKTGSGLSEYDMGHENARMELIEELIAKLESL